MKELRREQRQLCSDLIEVHRELEDGSEETTTVVLEDVSRSGACLQAETPIQENSRLRLICSDLELRGEVRYCLHRKGEGYFVGVEFEPGDQWSPDKYRPAHLLEPWTPGREQHAQPDSNAGVCNRSVCPCEVLSRVIDYDQEPLAGRVRQVASEVAQICGELEEPELRHCFSRLFRMGRACSLFQEFASAYRLAREELRESAACPSPIDQAWKVASILGEPEKTPWAAGQSDGSSQPAEHRCQMC